MQINSSVPSIKSIKLMTIIEAKNGTERRKVKMRNFLLNYLRYRDSNQIMIYIDCNRIKGYFDLKIRIQSL